MMRQALTYGAVASTGSAAWVAWGQGQAQIAGVVALGALLMVAARLRLAGLLSVPRLSRPTARRAATFVVAFSLVSGMVIGGVGPGGGAIGTASAWEMGTQGECDGLDYLVHVVSAQQINSDSCHLQFGDNTEMSTHIDHYQQGETLNDTNDAFLTAYQNFGQDTTSLAWSKAKITIVNGLNDGNTSSVVKGEANETVRDYYSKQQLEVARQIDRTYETMEYSYQQNNSFVGGGADLGTGSIDGFIDVEFQAVNGSTTWVRLPVWLASDYRSVYSPVPGQYITGNTQNNTAAAAYDSISYSNAAEPRNIYAYTAPTTDYDPVDPMGRWKEVSDAYSTFDNQSQQVTANVDAYVDSVYSDYQQGEINSTEIVDPETLASQAATDYNSSGYYSYAAVNLAGLGYAGNLNSSFHVTTATESYNGTLFYTGDDVTEFQTGQTYNVSNLAGTAYMAAQTDSGGTVVELDEDFTVESITNAETGTSMNSTSVESYTYDSTNSSDLGAELDRLAQLQEEYETMESGGGGGGIEIGGKNGAIAALLAVVLILALVRD